MHLAVSFRLFLGGAFFANSVPHLTNGVSGRPFQTPVASPLGKGLSSSTVNVLWGFANLLAAYLLVFRASTFSVQDIGQVLLLGAGALIVSVFNARHFGQFHGGR